MWPEATKGSDAPHKEELVMKNAQQNQVKADELKANELNQIVGGYFGTVDVSGMPDRTETCGTIWLLNRWPFPRKSLF